MATMLNDGATVPVVSSLGRDVDLSHRLSALRRR
jgi:hypothetical protein